MDNSKPPAEVGPYALRTVPQYPPAPRVHIPQSSELQSSQPPPIHQLPPHPDPQLQQHQQLQQQQQQHQQQQFVNQQLQSLPPPPPPQQQQLDDPNCSYPPPPNTMPDLPNSPRKTMSSTSAAVRNPQPQKKPGAPKPKGAVRAKSGCYTCRIRRKKCDEQPNAEGACQTCVRLRLQCLGFGAKRPDWMRENNSVTELREKIKTFLASQGMIKGHSGSGPRSTEGEPPVLVLVENLQQVGAPGTPPTPTMSATSQDGQRQQLQQQSFVRDNSGGNYHGGPPTMQPEHGYPQQPQQPQTTWSPHLPDLNNTHPHPLSHHHDPAMRQILPGPENLLYQTAPAPPQNNLMQSGSLVSPIATSSSSSCKTQYRY